MTYNVETDMGERLQLPIQCSNCQRVPPGAPVCWNGKVFCDEHCCNAHQRSEARSNHLNYQEGILNVQPEYEA